MKIKKEIAFLAPETKGGPYHTYKTIVNELNNKYGDKFDVFLFNSKKDWVKLHFTTKYDTIISVIPFLFKPLGSSKYIFNPRGNFDIEKKKNKLGNKLLYLSRYNLKFSDKIWLTSYFLADKLKFKNKYKDKIKIIPNFIKDIKTKNKKRQILNKNKIKLLTVSSTKFIEKGMGIVDLGKEVAKIKYKKIFRTIIAGGNEENSEIIKEEFNKIKFGENIDIKWVGWIERQKLQKYYKSTDIFVYGTRLDTWGGTIMEAMTYGLPIILLEYELWKYIYPKEIITKNLKENIINTIHNTKKYTHLNKEIIDKYSLNNVLYKLKKIL